MLCGSARTRKAPRLSPIPLRHGPLMTAIKVPPLGESIVEATVSRWLKKEGEQVAAGDTLVELETDKITVEVPALAAGVLTQARRERGRRGEGGPAARRARRRVPRRRPRQRRPPRRCGGPRRPRRRQRRPRRDAADDRRAAPRRLPPGRRARSRPRRSAWRRSRSVDLATVQGTGRGGVVSKPDVIEQGAKGRRRPPAPAAPRRAAPAQPAPTPLHRPRARRAAERRARDAREDDDAPEADRREPAAVAAQHGAPHDVQRDRHVAP